MSPVDARALQLDRRSADPEGYSAFIQTALIMTTVQQCGPKQNLGILLSYVHTYIAAHYKRPSFLISYTRHRGGGRFRGLLYLVDSSRNSYKCPDIFLERFLLELNECQHGRSPHLDNKQDHTRPGDSGKTPQGVNADMFVELWYTSSGQLKVSVPGL